MSLNAYAVNEAVLNGAGNNQYTQSVTASSSSTFTLVKSVAIIKSVASTSTVVKALLTGKFIAYVSTSAASIVKAIVKSLSFSSSSTTTLDKSFL